jgi:hypothetical protein
MGLGGAIFDWLRMLYQRMAYYAGHGDMQSAEFKAFIGLLSGDPASPILWNLFLADLVMMPDKDDIYIFAAARISLLAEADNILLLSISARGLRLKLDTLEKWCARNFILIKTIILIFGKIALPLPVFTLGTTTPKIKPEEKYVGVTFTMDLRNILQVHYKAKACTAEFCGHRIMAI